MLSKVRTALHQAVEEMVKEFDSSYEETKLNNEALKNNNRFLVGRIKELNEQCTALQAKKDCSALREENTLLLYCAEQQKEENEILHRKVDDLVQKLSQAHRERNELKKEVEDLQKKKNELIEQLEKRAILNSVLARKYEKLQIALNSDIGEAFECELDDKPFEKGYYLRISKEEYELSQDDRVFTRVVFVKHSDK